MHGMMPVREYMCFVEDVVVSEQHCKATHYVFYTDCENQTAGRANSFIHLAIWQNFIVLKFVNIINFHIATPSPFE